jgi:hypothetical protein
LILQRKFSFRSDEGTHAQLQQPEHSPLAGDEWKESDESPTGAGRGGARIAFSRKKTRNYSQVLFSPSFV